MADFEIQSIDCAEPDFDLKLDALLTRNEDTVAGVDHVVSEIIGMVRNRGDDAVLELTRKFDRVDVDSMEQLRIPRSRLGEALAGLDPGLRQALVDATRRIENYHRKQLQESWEYEEEDGTRLGQKVARWIGWVFMCPGARPLIHRRY